jgi:hypothetical protein
MELLTEAELKDLSIFFAEVKSLPKEILLCDGTTIVDLPRFIEHHLHLLRPDISPVVQKPALERIKKLKELLSARSNN